MDVPDYLNLTLQHFQCFLLVAEQGTMMRAAELLNISQPLMSQKIAQLEKAVGVKLFSRCKRTLKLTEAGERFSVDCKNCMQGIDEALCNLRLDYQTGPEQRLKIGFSDGHEPTGIQQLCKFAVDSAVDTKFDVEIENRLTLTNKLLNGEIDLCYVVDTEGLIAHKSISYRKLYNLSVSCIVNRTTQVAKAENFDWKSLNGMVCYWPSTLRKTTFTRDIQSFLRDNQIDLAFEYRDVDYFTLRRYLQMNDGVIFTLSRSLEDPMLSLLPLDGIQYPFIMAWRKAESKRLERFVERFMSVSKNAFKK